MSDVIEKIDSRQEEGQILTTINNNFKVLTTRMKQLNLNLSYLDILHIDKIHTVIVEDLEEGETKEEAQIKRKRLFIANCWNLLANYAGVFITMDDQREDSTEPPLLFQWQGEDVFTGTFIIKLPGNESIVVPGNDPKYYYPNSYNQSTGVIEYTMSTAAATTNPVITIPVVAATYANIEIVSVPGGTTVSAGGSVKAAVWYTTDFTEMVYLDSSYNGNNLTNSSNMALTAIVVLKEES